MTSFTDSAAMALNLIFSLDPSLMAIVARSLWVSVCATVIACALGLLLGAALGVSRFAGRAVLLAMLIGCGWTVLKWLHLRGLIVDREGHPAIANKDILSRNEGISLAVQTLITGYCLLVLMASEAKFQGIFAVGISSLVGGIVAQYLFPSASNGCYWLPPLAVGVIGYVLAYFNPTGVNIGELTGRFAALGRPVPLDYAGSGVAAAIIGHWLARAWQRGT